MPVEKDRLFGAITVEGGSLKKRKVCGLIGQLVSLTGNSCSWRSEVGRSTAGTMLLVKVASDVDRDFSRYDSKRVVCVEECSEWEGGVIKVKVAK